MKFLANLRAFGLPAILAVGTALLSASPAQAQTDAKVLLSNASSDGSSIRPSPGAHLLTITGTVGGATLALVETLDINGRSATVWSGTSLPSTQPCIVIPSGGVSLKMTVTGGSPSALYAALNGTAGANCLSGIANITGVGDASAAKQDTGNASLATINTAVQDLDTNKSAPVPSCAASPCVTDIGNVGAEAVYSGADAKVIGCDQHAIYDAATNGSTELIALSLNQTIYICGYTIRSAATAVNVEFDDGTGTACASNTNKLLPAWQLTTYDGLVDSGSFFRGLKTAASHAFCIKTSAGQQVEAIVYYTKF